MDSATNPSSGDFCLLAEHFTAAQRVATSAAQLVAEVCGEVDPEPDTEPKQVEHS